MDTQFSSRKGSTVFLHSHPFFQWHVSADTSVDALRACVEKRKGDDNDAILLDARNLLLDPASRLELEMTWLPGVTLSNAVRMLAALDSGDEWFHFYKEMRATLHPLARANYLAAALLRVDKNEPDGDLVDCIEFFFKDAWDSCAENVVEQINLDRESSGFPLLDTSAEVEAALKKLHSFYVHVMDTLLGQFSPAQMAWMVGQVAVRWQGWHINDSPPLLHDWTVSYNIRAEMATLKATEDVHSAIEKLQQTDLASDAGAKQRIAALRESLEGWHQLVYPLHLWLLARRVPAACAEELGDKIRGLVYEKLISRGWYDSAYQIIKLARAAFHPLHTITGRFEEDKAYLEGKGSVAGASDNAHVLSTTN